LEKQNRHLNPYQAIPLPHLADAQFPYQAVRSTKAAEEEDQTGGSGNQNSNQDQGAVKDRIDQIPSPAKGGGELVGLMKGVAHLPQEHSGSIRSPGIRL
jgi:hypothetical protein